MGNQIVALTPPHGDTLTTFEITDARPTGNTVSKEMTPRQYADLVMIATGAYSPLESFMGSSDYWSVIESSRLANGILWPIPITFQLHEGELSPGCSSLRLQRGGIHVATLVIGERFRLDLTEEASRIYGTTTADHPGVKLLYSGGEIAVSGQLGVHQPLAGYDAPEFFTPAQTREAFAERGWRSVAAFQTRNPIHRAHEYLHKVALEIVDGLFINPLVGHTKEDDVPAATRMAAYSVLLEQYYPKERTLLGVYPAAMRYAGPKEAVLHAISRKNFGCTHFIVGRDHAGVGDFYPPYAAQEIFDGFSPSDLDMQILRFGHTFYCKVCDQVASNRTCPHGPESHLSLSGTRVRQLLAEGSDLPPQFSRPEVAEVLRTAYRKSPSPVAESFSSEVSQAQTEVVDAGKTLAGQPRQDSPEILHTAESRIETIKRNSNGLRGELEKELQNGSAHFTQSSQQVLKFHGVYAQDNRDVRAERKRAGQDVEHICMVRLAIPGGRLQPQQYLAIDRLADLCGNGTLRVTTRQGIQFHFVIKGDIKPLIAKLREELLTTYAGCGDVVRNVTACPLPGTDAEDLGLEELAQQISLRYKPASNAYYEIWVDGKPETAEEDGPQAEPLYGDTYLPRKFKIGIASITDNCIDVLSCDLALVIDRQNSGIISVLVGGGLGRSHTDETTKALLAQPLAKVERTHILEVIDAIISIQRDHGDRLNRSHARFKYLVERWGTRKIRAEVERRTGLFLEPLSEITFSESCDHLGWAEQGIGGLAYGIKIPSGRITDVGHAKYKSAISDLVRRLGLSVRFTAKEDVILCGIDPEKERDVLDALARHGIPLAESHSAASRAAFACPALPTCGLALAESERFLPRFLELFSSICESLNLADPDIEVRMTGCPNGCARPYLAEIGIVGRSKHSYDIYLGADRNGNRLGEQWATDVPGEQLAQALRPVLALWASESKNGEGFGDFCHRCPPDRLRALAPEPKRAKFQIIKTSPPR